MEGVEEVKCYCLEGDSFFCLLVPLDSVSDPLGLSHLKVVHCDLFLSTF